MKVHVIQSTLRRAEGREMLARSSDASYSSIARILTAATLKTFHECCAKLSGQKGVLAKAFFDAAPAKLAGKIKDRREDVADTQGF